MLLLPIMPAPITAFRVITRQLCNFAHFLNYPGRQNFFLLFLQINMAFANTLDLTLSLVSLPDMWLPATMWLTSAPINFIRQIILTTLLHKGAELYGLKRKDQQGYRPD